MAYMALARKHRPGQFTELVGQDSVVRALTYALEHNRLHHAYLFSGTRGVGKTTVARLLARCLNCDQGISANPCGECDICRGITTGRFIDLMEIDAASHTGVDNIRELLDNALYQPVRGRYKIYLIDEVHMLSKQAFNALLITLEEPPEHVKFLLATTDPAKLPATILSRCLQFHLHNLDPKIIAARIEFILTAESVHFESDAVRLIAQAAEGSMRDALSLVDQAISLSDGGLLTDQTSSMLKTVDHRLVEQLFLALAENDVTRLLALSHEYMDSTPDVDILLATMAKTAHQALLAKMIPGTLDTADIDAGVIAKLKDALTIEAMQLYYQAALAGRKDLPVAPDPRTGLQMTLLRMLAFGPLIKPGDSSASAQLNNIAALAETALPPQPATPPASSAGTKALPPVKEMLPPVNASVNALTSAVATAADTALVDDSTSGMAQQLPEAVAEQAAQAEPPAEPANQPTEAAHEATTDKAKLPTKTDAVDIDRSAAESQAERTQRIQEKQDAAVEAIEQDRIVQNLREHFDASIARPSIRASS